MGRRGSGKSVPRFIEDSFGNIGKGVSGPFTDPTRNVPVGRFGFWFRTRPGNDLETLDPVFKGPLGRFTVRVSERRPIGLKVGPPSYPFYLSVKDSRLKLRKKSMPRTETGLTETDVQ